MQQTKVLPEPKYTGLNVPGLSFAVMHLLPLGALFTGATLFDWILCGVLYVVRMFWVTGGYHRYFSHKTYKTSRWFQFVIAFLAQTSVQKGALWWASHHRVHHRHSDTEKDPHSMKLFGFWYSHMGWIASKKHKHTEYKLIGDYAKYPELVWLNKNYIIPPLFLALLVMALGGIVNGSGIADMFSTAGLSTLFIGFFLSTVILYHGTFSINSLMHKFGKQRYKSGDESKNSLWLALITLGEGWHNNHHFYQVSARQGFFWWEIDITYYGLKMLSWVGLIWELRGVPEHIKYPEEAKRAA